MMTQTSVAAQVSGELLTDPTQPLSSHSLAAEGAQFFPLPAPYRAVHSDFPFVQLAQSSEAVSNTAADTLREQIATLYQDFLSYTRLILDESNSARLSIPGYRKSLEFIQYSREKATDAYKTGDYVSVNRIILTALAEIEKVNSSIHNQYELYLDTAKDAFESGQLELARESILWAEKLKPAEADVLTWKNHIESLPDLLAYRESAADARNKGDLSSELNALKQVLSLLPVEDGFQAEIGDVNSRINTLKAKIRDRNFANSISEGNRAVLAGNLKQARHAFSKAKKQRPNAAETTDLEHRITRLKNEIKVNNLLDEAEFAAKEDEWSKSLMLLEQVLALFPNHAEAASRRETASKIIDFQRQIDHLIARPERLSTPRISSHATGLIKGVDEVRSLSKRLSLAADELHSATELWQIPVHVHVISDGETHVSVRGVGQVGKTEERVIELRPGQHVFEGSRKGYRSVLVEVFIKQSGSGEQRVTVICHERI